jgi:predicted DCC family thiol-disulfide oxidoreductase YuxK
LELNQTDLGTPEIDQDKSIVFFDGVCKLCNRFVNFLIRKNSRKNLLFATLQGSAFQKAGINTWEQSMETVVFFDRGKTYILSSAALRALARLGGLWNLMLVFLIVPPIIRDNVYRWVAGKRYKWFGKMDSCRVPTPKEKEFFLD